MARMMAMEDQQDAFARECDIIRKEDRDRTFYQSLKSTSYEFCDFVSSLFLIAGFIALILIPFGWATLLDATCLFVIKFALASRDSVHFEDCINGMAENLAHVRANLAAMRKQDKGN